MMTNSSGRAIRAFIPCRTVQPPLKENSRLTSSFNEETTAFSELSKLDSMSACAKRQNAGA